MANKYPVHLYTVEIDPGLDLGPFIRHYRNAEAAGVALRTLVSQMNKSHGYESVSLYHGGRQISHYVYQAPIEARRPVPSADENGIRHYQEFGRYMFREGPPPVKRPDPRGVSHPMLRFDEVEL